MIKITPRASLLLTVLLFTVPLGTMAQGNVSPPIQDPRGPLQDPRDLTRRSLILDNIERQTQKNSKRSTSVSVPVLDKAAAERVELLRRVSLADAAPYMEILKTKEVGIFKVFPNIKGCMTKLVINVSPECADVVPLSSFVSFRQPGYVDEPMHDIEYTGNEIRVNGFFAQGAIVNLGDIELRNAIADGPLIKAIRNIGARDKTVNDARLTAKHLHEGVSEGARTFKDRSEAVVGHAYLLRSIAYRADRSLPPVEKSSPIEKQFHILKRDKREDITLVLKIVSRGELGGLTIVWRELTRSEAPSLRFDKAHEAEDFK